MSLLSEAMENCIMLDKITRSDGYGGYITTYVPGAEFDAAITIDNSIESRVGQQAGVTAIYTVTTKKAINLQYHDVFKRSRDDKIFRVKSDGDDMHTPKSATLNMRQVTAEEWELPNEQITSTI